MATAEQKRNASTIIQVGRSLGASDRDILIALMTALQESGLRNVPYGDRDSVGLFQQRNAWGSYNARMDPAQSARMFFLGGAQGQRGLFDFKNRNGMSLTQAAQAVQVSAFPNAYAKHEAVARSLLGSGGQGGEGVKGWLRPVRQGKVTHAYGTRDRPGGARHARGYDTGTDYGVPIGTAVYAAAPGKVVRVANGGAYGLRIELEHEGKLWTLYAHLSSAAVSVGDFVGAGQLIGKSGNSGNTTGPHLHFEMRKGKNQYGYDIDPSGYLNGNTTPGAYINSEPQVTTTTNQLQASDILGLAGVEGQTQAYLNKPYVYTNPIQMIVTPNVPGTETRFAQLGQGPEALSEPPATAEVEDPIDDLEPAGGLTNGN